MMWRSTGDCKSRHVAESLRDSDYSPSLTLRVRNDLEIPSSCGRHTECACYFGQVENLSYGSQGSFGSVMEGDSPESDSKNSTIAAMSEKLRSVSAAVSGVSPSGPESGIPRK